jgi:hypothetical protein
MEQPEVSLFNDYFKWVEHTEAPTVFHRWALIGAVGAFLGRQLWFPFGSSNIYPNQFIMFVGNPGTRKSTAIRRATKLIGLAGYETFSAQNTSKEKFLYDLAGEPETDSIEFKRRKTRGEDVVSILSSLKLTSGNDEEISDRTPKEVFIAADEFNNFMGNGNVGFQSLLGELWDWDEPERLYKQRLKNSKSIAIYQPTINILAGNTPANFAACFPLESIGQGFMSRLILVHSDESGKKITFPAQPDEKETALLVARLQQIKTRCIGELTLDDKAKHLMDTIYKTWEDLEDSRFKHYSTRRFTHLLKLVMIVTAMRISTQATEKDVIFANTILSFAESTMPKAIGELGKSRNSDASNKVMQALYEAREPKDIKALWKIVSNDLDKMSTLGELLQNLQQADKIQAVKTADGKLGYLARQKPVDRSAAFTNFSLLKGKELR